VGGAESECCWSRDQIWQACLVACPAFSWRCWLPGMVWLATCDFELLQVNRVHSTPLYSRPAKNSGFGLDHKCSIW